jgi:hypothetical protein
VYLRSMNASIGPMKAGVVEVRKEVGIVAVLDQTLQVCVSNQNPLKPTSLDPLATFKDVTIYTALDAYSERFPNSVSICHERPLIALPPGIQCNKRAGSLPISLTNLA